MPVPGTRLSFVAAVCVATAIGFAGPVTMVAPEAAAAARAPTPPKTKRKSRSSWPRVKAAPSKPETRPEDEKGRFMTKERICRTVAGRQVCFTVYRVKSKYGRSFMMEREDIWRR